MTPTERIQAQAKAKSIAKGFAVRIEKDGESTCQYFQNRENYEDFVNRALYQGYRVEAITQ